MIEIINKSMTLVSEAKRSLKRAAKRTPSFYAVVYIAMIPLYGLVYYFIPAVDIRCNLESCGLTQAIYYSIITITTLGYGDIVPNNSMTQIIAASQAMFGVVLIGLFLNALSLRHSFEARQEELDKEEKRRLAEAINRLRSYDGLIQLCKKRFLEYTVELTSPLTSRSAKREAVGAQPEEYRNFQFSDMKDLYSGPLLSRDSFEKPAVAYFYEAANELAREVKNLVANVDLWQWPHLQSACLLFLKLHRELNFQDFVLSVPSKKMGNGEKLMDLVVKMIGAHKGPPRYIESNVINGYVALYYLVHAGIDFLEHYGSLVRPILEGTHASEQLN